MSIETPSITAAWAAKTSCTTGRASSHEAQLMYMKSRTVIFPRKSARCTVFPSMSICVKSGAAFVAGGWNRTRDAAIAITTATNPATRTIVRGRSAPPADLTSVHTHGRYLLDSTREDSKGEPESLLFARLLRESVGPRGLLVLILLIAAIAVFPLPARAVGPSITNVTWNPWVPAHLEDVTVEADIASPGGTPNVTASWCVLPPFTCIPFTMWDLDRDGHYNSTPIRVAGPPYTGAHFNVSAIDPGGNFSFTEEIYVQFASTIAVDATLAPASTTPGQLVSVSGTALYENNASVPARFCSVDFELVGTASRWSVTSDAAGAFASTFNAPGSIGNYTVRTTVSNRTIVGSEDRYLLVATEPTPDLAVVISSLIVSPSSVTGGDTVTISVSVENGGTAAAGTCLVLIYVSHPSGL